MFEKIRKPLRGKNIASYIIFGLICLVFIFIGVPIGQISNLSGRAIMVNKQAISWADYQQYLEILRSQQQPSPNSTEDSQVQKQLRRQAIDTLLNTELIVQTAELEGLVVADKAVWDRIISFPVFHEDGRFMRSRYHTFLESRRWSAGHFENKMRREIQAVRFQNLFNQAIHTAELENKKNKQLGSVQIQVSYISFPSQELSSEEWTSFNKWIHAGQEKSLQQFIKNKKWKWEQTDSFDLSRTSLPKLNDSYKNLFTAVIHHIPKYGLGLVRQIVKIRDQSFVLKVNQFQEKKLAGEVTTPPASISSLSFIMDKMTGRMAFLLWIQDKKNQSKIQINPRLKSFFQ